METHHVITQQIYRQFMPLLESLGFQLDNPANLVPVPGSASASLPYGSAQHLGGHLESYLAGQRDALFAIREFLKAGGDPLTARAVLDDFVGSLGQALSDPALRQDAAIQLNTNANKLLFSGSRALARAAANAGNKAFYADVQAALQNRLDQALAAGLETNSGSLAAKVLGGAAEVLKVGASLPIAALIETLQSSPVNKGEDQLVQQQQLANGLQQAFRTATSDLGTAGANTNSVQSPISAPVQNFYLAPASDINGSVSLGNNAGTQFIFSKDLGAQLQSGAPITFDANGTTWTITPDNSNGPTVYHVQSSQGADYYSSNFGIAAGAATPPDGTVDVLPYSTGSLGGIDPNVAAQLPSSVSTSAPSSFGAAADLSLANQNSLSLTPTANSITALNLAGISVGVADFAGAYAALLNGVIPVIPDIPSLISVDVLAFGDASTNSNPVVLDLAGKGVNITQLTSSNTFVDASGDGYKNRTAWAGAGNGVLFVDLSGKGVLTQASQFEFTRWDPSATSDLQALASVFDTNHDGKLDAGDADFSKFFVVETNANGTQSVYSLAQLGIASINLVANAVNQQLPDGSSIDGETTFTYSNGKTGTAATVTFAYDAQGHLVTTTTTTNADGSTTVANVASNPDGSIDYKNILNTSANGLTKTLTEANAGGVATSLQTDVTTVSGATTTEVVTNYANGAIQTNGELTAAGVTGDEKLNSTTTVTSGNTVTISRDQLGGGWTTQKEVRTTTNGTLTSDVVSDLNADGSASSVTTTTTSTDGLTRTVTTLVDGIAADSTTSVDATVIGAASGQILSQRTETMTDSVGTTVVGKTVTSTQTKANAVTATTSSYLADGATLDLTTVQSTVSNTDHSTTTTQTDSAANGTFLDETVTNVDSTGLLKTTSTDANGGGTAQTPVFTSIVTDNAVVGSDGSRTETVTDEAGNKTVLSQTTSWRASSGPARAVTAYVDGKVTQTETVTVNGTTGATTDTLSSFNGDGSLGNETITTTSADGLTKTFETDTTGSLVNGAPVFDHMAIDATVHNGDGSTTETVTDYGATTAYLIDKKQTTTSANGLTITTDQAYTAGSLASGSWDRVTTDATQINADGGLTETITDKDGHGNVLDATIKQTSANRQTVTTTTTLGTTGLVKAVETVVTQLNGTVVDTTIQFDKNGDVLGATKTSTSADGLTKITQKDVQGQSATAYAANGLSFDQTTSDATMIGATGSRTETVSVTSNNSTLEPQSITTTSANGLSSATTTNIDGKVDYTTIDNTAIDANDNRIETITQYDSLGHEISAAQTTQSANGLLTTTLADKNGEGVYDIKTTDQTTLALDGSVTELVTATTTGSTPVTLGRTQTYTSADRFSVITSVDHTGDGVFDSVKKTVKDAIGNTVTTVDRYDPNDKKISEVVTTTHANGLYTQTQSDVNGDGVYEFTQTDATTLNQNGSQTETITSLAGTITVSTTVVATSADGTNVTTQKYVDGTAATGALVETDQTHITYNIDGSDAKTSTVKSQSGAVVSQSTRQISADQQTMTITTNDLQTTFAGNQVETPASSLETSATQPNGSVVDTVDYFASASASGPLLASEQTRTNANGLSRTVSWDLNGDGTYDNVVSDVASLNAYGVKTETLTVSDTFAGTAFKEQESLTKTTSANGLIVTVQPSSLILGDDTANFNSSQQTTINTDGSETTATTAAIRTQSGSTAVYSGQDSSVVTVSRNGLTKTTQISTFADKNSAVYRSDTFTTNLDGSTSESITNLNDNQSTGETKTIHVSADGRTIGITDAVNEDGLSNYANLNTAPANESSGNAISRTTTQNWTSNGGVLLNKETQSATLNGLSKTTTLDTTGSGTVDETKTDVTTFTPDGKTIETITETDASSKQLARQIITTSADGLTKTVTIAETGSVLATTVSTMVKNGDGSATTTAITTSPRATPGSTITRNKMVINTSADGRVTNITWDLNGDGKLDAAETSVKDASGAKSVTDTFYQPDGLTVSSTTTTKTSADGRMIAVSRSIAASPTSNTTETTLHSSDGSGSYSWTEKDSSGNELVYANHTIDANMIDYVDLLSRGTRTTYRIDAKQETIDFSRVQSIYTVLFGRTMNPEEQQTWLRYYTPGGLNVTQLSNNLMASSEFVQDYGSPNPADATSFVQSVYENAFGRSPNSGELSFWTAQLDSTSHSLSRANFVSDISRIADPAASPDKQFNLQATSPYPLPFGAGGGGGGGVPDSIITYGSYGEEKEYFEPITGFLQRTEFYSNGLEYNVNYYDSATGSVAESIYYYRDTKNNIAVADIVTPGAINEYIPYQNPSNLFDYSNVWLQEANTANGSIFALAQNNDSSLPYVYGTIDYSGPTSFVYTNFANRFSISGQLTYSLITDTTATDTTFGDTVNKFLVTGFASSPNEYDVIEYDSPLRNHEIGFGFDTGYQSSEFHYLQPASQLSFIPGLASWVAQNHITSIILLTNGPDNAGTITSSYATDIFGNNYQNIITGSFNISPLYNELPVRYGFLTWPGLGIGLAKVGVGSSSLNSAGPVLHPALTPSSQSMTLNRSSAATPSDTPQPGYSHQATTNASNTSITLASGVLDVINGSGDIIRMPVAGSSATINGNSNTINLNGTGASATVNGVNTINLAASNETLALGSSVGDVVNVASGVTNETISGSSATISVGANGGINLTGNSDVVMAASGSSVVVTGASDKIVASNSTIIVNAGSAVAINGSNDTIVMNGSSTVTSGTGSSGDTFVFHANFGHDTIYGFNASDYVQIDKSLFPDWAHLQAAIKPAGTTDAIIAYDANNTIAFNHVLPAQLNSAEFRFV